MVLHYQLYRRQSQQMLTRLIDGAESLFQSDHHGHGYLTTAGGQLTVGRRGKTMDKRDGQDVKGKEKDVPLVEKTAKASGPEQGMDHSRGNLYLSVVRLGEMFLHG